jgi:myo-inositol-1(or 4)-monophosphatase
MSLSGLPWSGKGQNVADCSGQTHLYNRRFATLFACQNGSRTPVPDYLKTCEAAARAGGKVLMEWIGKFEVHEKGPSDLVTEADVASQEAIRSIVCSRFPTHGFISEEQEGGGHSEAEYRWIVDPLDGTTNYVHGVPHYASSVALVRGDETVAGTIYDPWADECYSTARGEGARLNGRPLRTSSVKTLSEALVVASFAAKVDRSSPEVSQFLAAVLNCQSVRRTGSAALNLCYVAAGRFDAFWAMSTKAWDVAAGVLLVTEAGGMVTDLSGKRFSLNEPRPVATAGPELHAAFCQLLQSAPPLDK